MRPGCPPRSAVAAPRHSGSGSRPCLPAPPRPAMRQSSASPTGLLLVPFPPGTHSVKACLRGRDGRTSTGACGGPAHRPASAGGSELGPPRCTGCACLHQRAFCSPLALSQQNAALPGGWRWVFIFITRDIPCVTHTYTRRAHALTNGKARYEGLMLCCDTNNCCIA